MGPSVARKAKGTRILPSTSDGNFTESLISRRFPDDEGLVAGWPHGRYLYDFVAEISILATFFLRFFHLSRRKFEGGYTCDFHLALATRQNLKKSHHLRERKIARVAAALSSDEDDRNENVIVILCKTTTLSPG